jgi:hypothetical protein
VREDFYQVVGRAFQKNFCFCTRFVVSACENTLNYYMKSEKQSKSPNAMAC